MYHRKCCFLGYSSTVANIIYLNKDTKQIKVSNDYNFNKLSIDLDNTSPNTKILYTNSFGHKLPTIKQPSSTLEIIALDYLFLSLKQDIIKQTCESYV